MSNVWFRYLLILSGEILSYTLFPYYYSISVTTFVCPYSFFFCGLLLFIAFVAKYEKTQNNHIKIY